MKRPVALPLVVSIWVLLNGFVCCQKPAVVNIGAILTFDSVIGRVAKLAMEAAVSDVNEDPKILSGTELRLIMKDTDCSAFLGSVEAFQVMEKEVVAIIGPQSSGIAHMVSTIVNSLQVPLVSYAATDRTLSALQFPFFMRTTQSDSYQMAAIADLVHFYGWKEVIAIFLDDDYGRNGIVALAEELEKRKAKLSYKLPLPVEFEESKYVDLLNKTKSLGPRVYVVHVNLDPRLRIFKMAHKLQMMTYSYVWLATDWLSATLDSISPMEQSLLSVARGVVALRQHTPASTRKSSFTSRWKKMQKKGSAATGLNTYGQQAYDTVWVVAYAIDSFIKEFNNITFSFSDKLVNVNASKSLLGNLKVFSGGTDLLKKIAKTNFTGLSGQIEFNQDRNIIGGYYDVINIDNKAMHTVGYWSNNSGFSLVTPETHKGDQNGYFGADQKLKSITWPGGKTERPRGWVIADDERPLRIGVPNRVSFAEFVTKEKNTNKIQGYCIDVFLEARKLVPYHVPFIFKPFGNGQSNPSYDGLINMVAKDIFDAAIGDITVVANRMKLVDFSQPFAATGLAIVAPVNKSKPSTWVFLEPFTVEMWCVTGASFVVIGVVIWILERRVNDDFRGPPKRQLVTVFMFSFSTLFRTNRETTISPLGRMVMVVWLFLLMVVTASYTASLTSILTVQQLSSPITGVDSLVNNNWPIGYQVGSFAYAYLSENLHISRSRLKALGSPEEYERALRQGPSNGGVAAIVDELPYIELFLKNQDDFGIIGQQFTWGGWGFAFQRDSPLVVDISSAILRLSEKGELQKIHERWFCKTSCPEHKVHNNEPKKLRLISFWGLYLLCGGVSLTALLVFLLTIVRQFIRYKRRQMQQSSTSSISPSTGCSQHVLNFFDFIDEKEEAIKNLFKPCENSQPQASLGR
uniref:Glutamate receptor n=3 Tax=Rhizophora mucronata TaxID=61149 RepID=A0A2P2J985_RHIMU